MVQQLLAGDIVGALKGIEAVFYFTPGSRYLRTVGAPVLRRDLFWLCLAAAAAAVSGVLPVPAIFHRAHRAGHYADLHRNPGRRAVRLDFLSLRQARRARLRRLGRGRAVPGRNHRADRPFAAGARRRFAPGVRRGLAVCHRGVRAAQSRRSARRSCWAAPGLRRCGSAKAWRLAGMCIGFLPVFSMALHNWYYGGVFVLFSSHTGIAAAMPMPPHAYVSALWELLRLDFRRRRSGARRAADRPDADRPLGSPSR